MTLIGFHKTNEIIRKILDSALGRRSNAKIPKTIQTSNGYIFSNSIYNVRIATSSEPKAITVHRLSDNTYYFGELDKDISCVIGVTFVFEHIPDKDEIMLIAQLNEKYRWHCVLSHITIASYTSDVLRTCNSLVGCIASLDDKRKKMLEQHSFLREACFEQMTEKKMIEYVIKKKLAGEWKVICEFVDIVHKLKYIERQRRALEQIYLHS